MSAKKKLVFHIIAHGSPEYDQAIRLCEEILDKPEGAFYAFRKGEADKKHIHIAGFSGGDIAATAMLVADGKRVKMQRVAVRPDLQGKGVGSQLMQYFEKYASSQGFREIYLLARDVGTPSVVQFYQRNGYQCEGDPVMEHGEPHRTMRKLLKK